jgi:hypothetical protein
MATTTVIGKIRVTELKGKIVQGGNCSYIGDGVSTAEASDIGLKPGEWPDMLLVMTGFGNGDLYEFESYELGVGAVYVTRECEGLELRVIND